MTTHTNDTTNSAGTPEAHQRSDERLQEACRFSPKIQAIIASMRAGADVSSDDQQLVRQELMQWLKHIDARLLTDDRAQIQREQAATGELVELLENYFFHGKPRRAEKSQKPITEFPYIHEYCRQLDAQGIQYRIIPMQKRNVTDKTN